MLFKTTEGIPIGIVIEPLIKQLQVVDVSAKTLNIYDLEFLMKAAEHPKLSQKHAIQLLDLFAKIYLNNLIFAPQAGRTLLKLITSDLDSEPIKEYVMKFVKIALATLFTSLKNKQSKEKLTSTYNDKQATLKPTISNSESESEILNAQKRALIIEIIRSIITLGNSEINEDTKTLLLHTYRQLMLTVKIEHKGIRMLLALYGNAEGIIAEFQKMFEKVEDEGDQALHDQTSSTEQKSEEEKEEEEEEKIKVSPIKSELLPPHVGSKFRNSSKSKEPSPKKLRATALLSSLKGLGADPKVLQGIEEVRKNFSEKTLKILETKEAEKEKFELRHKSLKPLLNKRMIELGVAQHNKPDAVVDIIYPEGSIESQKANEKKHGLPEIIIVNLEQEEERDRYGVNVVMRRYAKALRYLFDSYANSGFSAKDAPSFDQLEKKLQLISVPEVWKLLKEHDLSHLISQVELKTLIRLTNTEIMKHHELNCLTFEGFKNFMVQLSIFVFSRPPENLSHLPIFCAVSDLFLKCREAEAKRGINPVLYDDPDSKDLGDPQLNKHLNQLLKKDPEHPIPEVF